MIIMRRSKGYHNVGKKVCQIFCGIVTCIIGSGMVHTERRKRAVSGKGRRTYQERLKNMADIGLWRQTIVCIAGLGAGILVSAGVFTVLLSVGLVPRFAGKTHTGEKIFLYEEMIVLGTLTGCFWSVYPEISRKGFWFAGRWLGRAFGEGVRGSAVGVLYILLGLFAGVFVGCLALAVAEMLDSIPILTRRIGYRHGLGLMVLAVALGKLTGSLLYFGCRIFTGG